MNKRLAFVVVGVLALLAVVVTGYCFRTVWADAETQVMHDDPEQKIDLEPLMNPEVIETVSAGEVFLTCWCDNKFQRFSEMESVRFDSQRPAVVLVHGLFESSENEWFAEMAAQIAKTEPNTKILGVDWAKPALNGKKLPWDSLLKDAASLYSTTESLEEVGKLDWWRKLANKKTTKNMVEIAQVVERIPPIAQTVTEYLFGETGLNLKPESTHLIGFSHGAHLAGLIGQKTDGTLRRLTLLDPSSRLVHYERSNWFGTGWSSQSAQFTDMYQTSTWAGSGKAYGHRTFKVIEEGRNNWLPPSPAEDARRHYFAPKWFASTIGSEFQDYGYSMTIPTDAQFQEGTWTATIVVEPINQ